MRVLFICLLSTATFAADAPSPSADSPVMSLYLRASQELGRCADVSSQIAAQLDAANKHVDELQKRVDDLNKKIPENYE